MAESGGQGHQAAPAGGGALSRDAAPEGGGMERERVVPETCQGEPRAVSVPGKGHPPCAAERLQPREVLGSGRGGGGAGGAGQASALGNGRRERRAGRRSCAAMSPGGV